MNESIVKMIANKRLATFRVQSWIGTYTKGQICEILGISRQTLQRRLNSDKWTYKELELINKYLPF